jgi:hypothetical protein
LRTIGDKSLEGGLQVIDVDIGLHSRKKKLKIKKAAVSCAMLDGDTMANQDTRWRRDLALLVRFAVFTAMGKQPRYTAASVRG